MRWAVCRDPTQKNNQNQVNRRACRRSGLVERFGVWPDESARMMDRTLDPAGPILGVLFGARSSDLVVDVVSASGLPVDWSLNGRQNYSNSTRIREYRV